jgi:chemotaxis protein methyltransferase CheR
VLAAPYSFALEPMAQVGLHDFDRAQRLLRERSGIVLGTHKREVAMRKLALRAQRLGLAGVVDYLDRLEGDAEAPEWDHFVNTFTINHTAFFREAHHFQILADWARKRSGPLSIWSCAASTGEEPYSIAMALCDAIPAAAGRVKILASDIDTQAVESARRGVYPLERAKPVSQDRLRKYFYRGRGAHAGMVRIKPEICGMVEFRGFNLAAPVWPADLHFDAVFCRNIMIYFDKDMQTAILGRFAKVIRPGGLLFAGHSENFTYLTSAFRLQGQTVYAMAAGGRRA